MLEYYGDIDKLKTQITDNQKDIDRVIKDLLGKKKNYDKLRYFSEKFLIPEAFYDFEEYNKLIKESDYSIELSSKDDNKFIIFTNQSDQNNFSITNEEYLNWKNSKILRTAPIFLIDKKGFEVYAKDIEGINIPHELASYIHEYCHFINYALQDVPMIAAAGLPFYMLNKLGYTADLESLVQNIKPEHSKLFSIGFSLLGTEEARANALTGLIWKKMGEPRLLERSVNLYKSEQESIVALEQSVDLLEKGMSNYLWDWNKYSKLNDNFVKTFVRSLSDNIKVRKITAKEYF